MRAKESPALGCTAHEFRIVSGGPSGERPMPEVPSLPLGCLIGAAFGAALAFDSNHGAFWSFLYVMPGMLAQEP
jgi:hypothetical protein